MIFIFTREWRYKLLENKIYRNISYTVIANIIGSILNILNMALLVKELGLELNGIIFLALNYSLVFDALFNFQSYQSIIKFLPNDLENKKNKGKNYIIQAIIIDLLTAFFSIIIANLFLNKIADFFKWNSLYIEIIKLSTIIIIFNMTSVPTGVLRVYSKFKELALLNLIIPVLTILGNIFLINYRIKKIEYYIITIIFSRVVLFILSWIILLKILRQKKMNKLNLLKVKFDKDFLRFLLGTNLLSTLDLPIHYLTPFIFAKYLAIEDLSIYKIIEKLGNIIKMFTMILAQILSPEISKDIANSNQIKARKMVIKIGIGIFLLGIIGLIVFKITYIYWLSYFIPNYKNYLNIVYIFFAYIIISQSFILLHSFFLFLGYVKFSVYILVIANFSYLVSLYYTVQNLGFKGIIYSLMLQSFIVIFCKLTILKIKREVK